MSYIGKEPQVGAYNMLDSLTASATADYSLTLDSTAFVPESANHLIVSLNGVIQKAGSSFTVSGSTLSFSSALTSSDSIDFVLALGNVLDIGTPSDGTISASKLATTSITGQTAETSANDSDSLLIYDDSATALRKMTRSNFLSGVGGENTPYFQVYKSANQGIANGTFTTVTFDTEEYDTGSDFSSNTFTAPSTGYYYIYSQLVWNGGTDSNYSLNRLMKNGTAQNWNAFFQKQDSGGYGGRVLYLSSGDAITVQCYQDSGITLQLRGGSADECQFGGFKLIGV